MTTTTDTQLLARLMSDPSKVGEVSVEVVPGLIVRLSALQAALATRLTDRAATGPGPSAHQPDRLLTAKEVAAMLGRHPSYIYHNAQRFPFTRREGHGLRFSLAGVQKYIQSGKR